MLIDDLALETKRHHGIAFVRLQAVALLVPPLCSKYP
jgi:hypothetical protein